jgi:hypothetical protein
MTLKETSKFELIEGTGAGAGCFRVIRKKDNLLTLWNTGTEGSEWKDELLSMNDKQFDIYCNELNFE